jgi:hypothetical protein
MPHRASELAPMTKFHDNLGQPTISSLLDAIYLRKSDCLAMMDRRDGRDRMCLYDAGNFDLLKVGRPQL